MTQNKALIQRLQEATEGSRELDSEVALATGWTHHIEQHDDDMTDDVWTDPSGKEHSCYHFFTRSIDAAMTLAPEGCMWNLGGNPNGGFASAGLFGASIWQGIDQIHGEAPTPALALCIAALSAKEDV